MPDTKRPRGYPPAYCPVSPRRREVFTDEGVLEELQRWNATTAFVRFSGGGGSRGSIGAVTLEDGEKRVLVPAGPGLGIEVG
jgi:hypothetical protein